MLADIGVFKIAGHNRSTLIADSMLAGITKSGDRATMIDACQYRRGQVKIAVFYGFIGLLRYAFKWQAMDGGTAVYVDLGYFGRHDGGRWTGFHKVSVNSRHPTAYFQARPHDGSRAKTLGLKVQPWRENGTHILLAGMGGKAAMAEGREPLGFERKTAKIIRSITDRPIIYRPKPSDRQARPIAGCGYSPPTQDLEVVLENAHAIVTHHSNVAVDGLVAGIPAFAWAGVAMPLALQDLKQIETPLRPDGREQWLNDIAWTQFSVAEIAAGVPWRHLKDEGLV